MEEERRRRIVGGFRIKAMVMVNRDTDEVMWRSPPGMWNNAVDNVEELKVVLPQSILSCPVLLRNIEFESTEEIDDFRMRQCVRLNDDVLEEWTFRYGKVEKDSTNLWQCVVESAPAGQMLPADVLSGHLTIRTEFYDGDTHLCFNVIRVFYE